MNTQHELFMHRCLQLASLGLATVKPNPMVGAVLVFENKIIGEGYHEKYGEAHAEINCLQSVAEKNKHLIADSTLFVSLEPCCHEGKTPPCTNAIIKAGIKKVVFACRDSFAQVNGKGIDQLRQAGVDVVEDVLQQEALKLNRRFFTFHEKKRPYIILKWAQSADGFLGKKNERTLLSNVASLHLLHHWRSEEDAIWIGYKTAMIDNPALNVRLVEGKNPIRLVYDRDLSLPFTLTLLSDGEKTFHFHSNENKKQEGNLYVEQENWLKEILCHLHSQQIQSVIIEGGEKLLHHFIEKNLWDEARVFETETVLAEGVSAPRLLNPVTASTQKLLNNNLKIYLPSKA